MENFVIRNLKDVEEIEKVPLEQRIKEKSTYEMIVNGASINPDAPAISFLLDGNSYKNPQVINYREFLKKIRQTANLLYHLGVRENDVVSYILPNLPQTHYVLWGAEVAGIAGPINPLLEPQVIKEILNAANTKVLVALGQFPGADIWEKVEQIIDHVPSLTHVIRIMGPSDKSKNIIGYEEVIENYNGESLDFNRDIEPDDIASIYHTGGTTGRPKLARRTHFNEVVVAYDLKWGAGLNPGETVMVGLPLFHCNGTIVTGLMPFSIGGHVVMLSPKGYREPSIIKNFYKIVEEFKPVFFSCVPTVLSMLLDVPVEGRDISSLRYVVCGAAPLSVELFKRFEEKTKMKILEGYGLTEVAVASCVNPKDGERKIGSVGIRLPYQKVATFILDEDNKFVREAKTNEIGVVCISGPCVFKGYVEEEHNKGIWPKQGWFNTGDLGRIDEDGYLFLTGRKKDLIIRGGHNIDPSIIEETLYKLPEVKTAAAVGKPDSYAGEVPIAYVELSEGAKITEEELMEFARKNIGERAAVPKQIIIVDQIPLTPVGKVFKPALRWDAAKRTFEGELEKIKEFMKEFSVDVGEDKLHGTKVNIEATPTENVSKDELRSKISELFSNYPFYYEINIKE